MTTLQLPSVTLGDGLVVVRRKGVSHVTCAQVLGSELTPDGRERLYLDRLVHRPFEEHFEGWEVSGAISTILTRGRSGT